MEYQLTELKEIAAHAVKSNLFGMPSPEAAFSLMLVCLSEGIHPVQALRRYHIIKGRPAMRADAMQAGFIQAGGKIQWLERSNEACEAIFSHPAGGEVNIRWTIDMAKQAGLTGNDNWRKYPRQMLHARCVSEGVRTVYPAIVCGFYTPEEVSDFDTKETKKKVAKEPEPIKAEVVKDVREVKAEVIEVKAQEPEPAPKEKVIEITPIPAEEAIQKMEEIMAQAEPAKESEPVKATGAVLAEKIKKARVKAMEFGCRNKEDFENFTETILKKRVSMVTSLSLEELDAVINFKENTGE